jgi:hypothetical protein
MIVAVKGMIVAVKGMIVAGRGHDSCSQRA